MPATNSTMRSRTIIDAKVVDAATAAETIAELEGAIATLKRLQQMGYDPRRAGTDAKWQQLSDTLSEAAEMHAAACD